MKNFRRFAFALIISLLTFSLFASNVSYSTNYQLSSISNPAYYGTFNDIYANPAALPLSEDDGNVRTALSLSEIYDIDVLAEPIGYIQNQVSNVDISIYNKNVSMTIKIGSSFSDRSFRENSQYPFFDIYSHMDLELALAYAFPYVSIGGVLRGGNSMVRMDKEVTDLGNAIANSYLSPFERMSNSERFSIGLGALGYFDNYSLGVVFDDLFIITAGEVKTDFSSIFKGMSISFAAYSDKYTPNGDLRLFRPRASIFYGNFNSDTSTGKFMINGGVDVQLLSDFTIVIGMGYHEHAHKAFKYNKNEGELCFNLRGIFDDWDISTGISVDTETFKTIKPIISVAYHK